MSVGLVENPPWVIRTNGQPAGAEVELISRFASEIGAVPKWQWGGEEKLLGALENSEIDVVIGGFTESSPWVNRIGMTSSYYKERFDIGVPLGSERVTDLSGRQIAVMSDSRLAGLLRDKDAQPVDIGSSPAAAAGLTVAAAEWQLERLGLTPSDYTLQTDRHVVMTPPGENQLVKQLDEFLSRHKDDIPDLLMHQLEARKR